MMNKSELAKIISKKAAVVDSSIKEFFDLFLQRIAAELNPGESVRFSNVGYFHFRKGKLQRESDNIETNKFEYLDLIIFSPSKEFNFKSSDNLVFSVPEAKDGHQDKIDSHFSLSVGKPVLPNLESISSYYPAVQSPEDLERLLKRKVENLMVNVEKEAEGTSDSEILLVDVKTIYEDQLELELDAEIDEEKTYRDDDTAIHSSEKLKSLAWGLGKDLSNQIDQESIGDEERSKFEELNKSHDLSWDFGKRFWDNQASVPSKEKSGIDKIEPRKTKSDEKNKSIKIGFPKADIESEKEVGGLGIQMNDFEVTEREERIGNFERVRSISSSVNGKKSVGKISESRKVIDKQFETEAKKIESDEEFKKVTSKAEQFHTSPVNDKSEQTIISKDKKKPVKSIKLNRRESLKRHKHYERKSALTRFLTIAAIMILIVVVFYILMKNSNTEEITEEVIPPVDLNKNATYVERSYDIPVTYPYPKSDEEIKITGLGKNELIDVKTEPVKEETKPPTEKVPQVKKQTTRLKGEKPTEAPLQAAYNIYQYGNIFAVQIGAFRSKDIADNEVKRYLGKGHNAFIEEAVLEDGMWYRVRVGNFKTLEEAKQFRSSN